MGAYHCTMAREPEHKTPAQNVQLPPIEENGWDLLDDYQVGKDVGSKDARTTRRFIAGDADSDSTPSGETARSERARTRSSSFWRRDGSAEQDAEVMARIMAGKAERDAEVQAAVTRSKAEAEREAEERKKLLAQRERIRERQQREIAMYLEMAGSRPPPPADETPLQRALRDVSDAFLALGICPDHLEYLPDCGKFYSWGGRIYDHTQIFGLRDKHGRPLYTFGPSPHGDTTICYSPRELRWGLHRPVAPADKLTPVERLLPVPRRHGGGNLRYSAQRPGTVLMGEGMMTMYVVRNSVYTLSQLQAVHFLHAGTSPLLDAIVEKVRATQEQAAGLARKSTRAIDGAAESVTGRMVNGLGTVADSITNVISSTTRLFRRKPPQ